MERERAERLIASVTRKAAERIVGRDSGVVVERTAHELSEEIWRALDEAYVRGMREWQAQTALPLT